MIHGSANLEKTNKRPSKPFLSGSNDPNEAKVCSSGDVVVVNERPKELITSSESLNSNEALIFSNLAQPSKRRTVNPLAKEKNTSVRVSHTMKINEEQLNTDTRNQNAPTPKCCTIF